MATVTVLHPEILPRLAMFRAGELHIGVGGAHGPITFSLEPLAQRSLEYYYHLRCDYPGQVGAHVTYNGHREDLIAAGCITSDVLAETRYDRFHYSEDGRVILCISSKAGPGKRGWLEIWYITIDRGLAISLPGVRDLFPEGLTRSGPARQEDLEKWLLQRPHLRLVVNNTRTGEATP